MNSNEHIDDLIARYLTGEATPEQIKWVESWRDSSEGNRKYFEDLQFIFERAARPTVAASFDTDKAWHKLRLQMQAERPKVVQLQRYHWWRAAAVLLAVLTAGLFAYRYFSDSGVHTYTLHAQSAVKADTLPDGSVVFLNRESKIEFVVDERRGTRTAKLEGEAHFSIEGSDKKTFMVEAGETLIRDIGTVFNVKAYADSSAIEVVVEEGEVWFYTERNSGIHVTAGHKGVYNRKEQTFSVTVPEPNVTAYQSRSFTFRNDPLRKVVKTLNTVYNQKFRIDDNLQECKLTVSFHDEEPDEIAAIIAETLGLSISSSEEAIHLKGSGCGTSTP